MDIEQAIKAMSYRFKQWVHLNAVPHTDAKYIAKATELNAVIDGYNTQAQIIAELRKENAQQTKVIVEYERRLSIYGQSITNDYEAKFKELQTKYNEITSTRNVFEQMLVMRFQGLTNTVRGNKFDCFNEQIREQSKRQLQQDMPQLF